MILLLGATGYVGRRFLSFFDKLKIPIKTVSALELLNEGQSTLRNKLQETKPAFLINAAGYTGKPTVDACEENKHKTLTGNLVLPIMVSEACAAEGIPWGHISSGCIYNGNRGVGINGEILGFREDDPPNFDFCHPPCSFYSGTKSMAERLLERTPEVYIWRLRIPFHEHDDSRNYLSKLMRYPRLLDVRNSLSHLDDFIASCWSIYENQLPFGIYNLTNHGSVTTREVVQLIQDEGRRRGERGDSASSHRMNKEYHFFDSEAEFMQETIKTPRSSCVLDTEKAKCTSLPMRPIQEALMDALQRWTWESTS